MIPSNKYLSKYLLEAAIMEVEDEYRKKGFKCIKGECKSDITIDLLAIKKEKIIAFEFIVADAKKRRQDKEIIELKKITDNLNAELKLIYVNSPNSKTIEIFNIEEILYENIINDVPDELDRLSTHTSIDYVSDVEINSIIVKEDLV